MILRHSDMSKIKKWFDQKKVEFKFSRMGPGHSLTESNTNQGQPLGGGELKPANSQHRKEPPASSHKAGAAAISRFENQQQLQAQSKPRLGLHGNLKETMEKQILESERQKAQLQEQFSEPVEIEQDAAPVLAVKGVYFNCPLISEECLELAEWKPKIRSFLYEQMADEPSICAAIAIKTLNSPQSKIDQCLQTIYRYLDNIVSDPTEPKYRKIRLSNKVFQEKVHPACENSLEFLLACGFEKRTTDDSSNDEILVLPDSISMERLKEMREILHTSEPIQPELARCTALYEISANVNLSRMALPSAFYEISSKDVELEYQRLRQEIDSQEMLRTKAMRENAKCAEIRRYRFTLIRIRLPPNGRLVLQGTFSASEPLAAVLHWLKDECLLGGDSLQLNLFSPTNQRLTDYTQTLSQLNLCPAVVLNLHLEGQTFDQSIIQTPLLALKQPLS